MSARRLTSCWPKTIPRRMVTRWRTKCRFDRKRLHLRVGFRGPSDIAIPAIEYFVRSLGSGATRLQSRFPVRFTIVEATFGGFLDFRDTAERIPQLSLQCEDADLSRRVSDTSDLYIELANLHVAFMSRYWEAIVQRTIDLTLDSADARVMAAFWKLALGYIDAPAPKPFKSRGEWLASFDVPEEEWHMGAWLCDPTGVGPRLSILTVPEAKVAKNRLHIDIRVTCEGDVKEQWRQLTAQVNDLVEAGGRILEEFVNHHVVMADPEGNEFCVAFRRS
jgi:hypothetical protein